MCVIIPLMYSLPLFMVTDFGLHVNSPVFSSVVMKVQILEAIKSNTVELSYNVMKGTGYFVSS
jgi:hypothetical protein